MLPRPWSGDRIPVGSRFFAHVQTGPGGPLSLQYNGYRVFPGVKRPGRCADHPLLVPLSRMSRAIPLLPLWTLRNLLQGTFTFTLSRPWSLWGACPARANSHGRTGNRTRDLVVNRSCDHQATRLVTLQHCKPP
jgi:hypothetical protein